MTNETNIIELTADIVAAHVSNNSVAVADVASLVRQVHQALSKLGGPPPQAVSEKRLPAVSARASVKPDFITCMVCGTRHKTLKRHIRNAHGMVPEEYRAEFQLPSSYPMVAPDYSKRRGELARASGLGRKIKKPPETGSGGSKKEPKRRAKKASEDS